MHQFLKTLKLSLMLHLIMKKISNLLIFTFVTGSLWISNTQAGPFYIKGSAGISKLKEFCASPASGFSCVDISPTVTLDGGYQLSDTFGLELGYGTYGSPKSSGTTLGANLDVIENISGLRFAATATLPVTNSFALTGRLGVSRANLTVNSTLTPGAAIPSYTASSTSLSYGAGIRYSINKYYGLHVQYENLGKVGDDTIGTDTLSLLTVGISYSLGRPKPTATANRPVVQGQPPAVVQPPKSQAPQRVIVFLKAQPPEDKQQLSAAVAEACQCTPVFVRMYSNTAVIYQISLPLGQTLTEFNNKLLSGNSSLGIKTLMQTSN
jgi:OOP family OmpA-OmpF porin